MTVLARLPRLGLLAAILAALTVVATGLGSSAMPLARVTAALFGQGERMDEVIVWTLRLPRVVLAVLAGMALALAGALLQRVTRNPIAAPSILGITDGAAVGVVAFLWIFSDDANLLTVSIHWQPLAAVIGAFAFAALVAALAVLDPAGRSPLRVILYGIALAALAKAAVTLMMILGPVYRANQALTWLTGSVGAAHWSDVAVVAAGLAIAAVPLAAMRGTIRQLVLDADSAAATGVPLGSWNPAGARPCTFTTPRTRCSTSSMGASGSGVARRPSRSQGAPRPCCRAACPTVSRTSARPSRAC